MGGCVGQKAEWPEPLPPWPDSEPRPPARLTLKQFNLLLHVLIKSHKDPTKPVSFAWSPKTFLGRAPTASESVTLSKRLKGLVTAGYVSRSGRSLEISELGKNVLLVNSYWLEKGKLEPSTGKDARLYLELLDIFEHEVAIPKVRSTAQVLRRYTLVEELDELAETMRKIKDDALRRIKSNNSDDT